MCGISGIVLPHDQEVDRPILESMGRVLQHRGPDNYGTHIHENAGFVHNRLSNIDLSEAANQPFHTDHHVLIYNGEIYNHSQLRKELEREGIHFRSSSDSEVLFQYLIHKGIDRTLSAIKGMFAFAFFDKENKTLFLARDRFGIKPIYWLNDRGNLYFSSEVKAITTVASASVDPIKALFSIHGESENLRRTSLFKNVQAVAPGTYLRCRPGSSPKIVEYFNLINSIDRSKYDSMNRMSTGDITEQFSSLLESSIKSMLMSDCPIGAFVSGGVDSSLISTLANHSQPNIELFSANVIGKYSEIDEARLLADILGLPLHEYEYQPHMLLRDWVESTWHYETPIIRHLNAIPFGNVAKLASSRGIKPVLTGEGADELFLGYPRLGIEKYRAILTLPNKLLEKLYSFVPEINKRLILDPALSHAKLLQKIVGEDLERQQMKTQLNQALDFLPIRLARFQQMSVTELQGHLLGLLHRNDRMGMLASIESRFPFLDEDLVSFGINLPVKWKIRPTFKVHNRKHPFFMDKFVVRNASKLRLPNTLSLKKKQGFPTYGFRNISVRDGFFDGGYLSEITGLQSNQLSLITGSVSGDDSFLGRCVSVEIFGRLFEHGQQQNEIQTHLERFVSMPTQV